MRRAPRPVRRIPMAEFPRCASCGIRKGNRLFVVTDYEGTLICEKCIVEAARGAVMEEDPEYLRPPGAEKARRSQTHA